MQHATILSFVLFGTVASASRLHRSQGKLSSTDEQDHPVKKVIALLMDLSQQVTTQQQEEEYVYGKFEKWCKDNDRALSKAIAHGKEQIDSLQDKVGALEKEEEQLEKAIAEYDKQILAHDAASIKAKDAREEENGLWKDADQDYEQTIKAVDDAIKMLENTKKKVSSLEQAKAVQSLFKFPMLLAQLSSEDQEKLRSVGGADSDVIDVVPGPAPAPAHAPYAPLMAKGDIAKHQKKYVFKSDNVIELLKNLKMMFEDERLAATKAETNAENNYQLAEDSRQKLIATAKASKKEKQGILSDVQSDLSSTKKDLKGYIDDVDADEKSLQSTKESCQLKATQYSQRVEIMNSEKEAIAKAIEILKEVTGVRTEQPTNPVPPPSPLQQLLQVPHAAFLQMPPRGNSDRQRAINLLRTTARKSGSQAFADMAEQVAAAADGDGPFKEINDMIQNMIFRLMAEQRDENEHKAWCDTELEKVNISMTDKTEKIEILDAKIHKGKAKVLALSTEIEDANNMVSTIETFMEEATAVREAGKAENKAAIKDAKDAQEAIAQATAVLEQHYKQTGMMKKEAWEFVQQREPVKVPKEPSTWDASYTGIADPNNQPDGIISMLKEISADFAKMEADTLASEQMDQKAYEEEIKNCKIEKAERLKEAEMKTDEKRRVQDKTDEYEKDLKHVENELYQVNQYLKDLQPACVEGDSTYEARKAAREMEIEALKEAQVILETAFDEDENATSFLQIDQVQSPHAAYYGGNIKQRIRAEEQQWLAEQKVDSTEVPAVETHTPSIRGPIKVNATNTTSMSLLGTGQTLTSMISAFFNRLFF